MRVKHTLRFRYDSYETPGDSMSKNRRLLLGHLLSSTALVGASAVGLTVTAPVGSALADCSTGMPMPGQTVNCSGVDNTGVYAGNGYRNITVNLLAGASIENPGTNAIDLNGSSSVNLQAGSLIETNGFDAIRFSDQQPFYSGRDVGGRRAGPWPAGTFARSP